MIIINNFDIIEKVVINNNNLEQVCFEINSDKLKSKKIIPKDIFSSNEIPFIEIPLFYSCKNEIPPFHSSLDETILECKIGYIDKNTNKQNYSKIKIRHIEIESVKVKVKGLYKSDFDIEKNWCLNNVSFKYEIKIKIIDFNKKSLTYTFNKETVVEKKQSWRSNFSSSVSYPSNAIRCLIKDIIPILNEYVDAHNPIEHINFSYIECIFNNKSRVHPFEFTDALNIIYGIKFNENCIELGNGLEPYMNNYVASLIASIMGCDFKYDCQLNIYTTLIPNIPKEIFIPKETYIKCLLYLGLYANYDKNMAKKNFLILPYKKIDFNNIVHVSPDRKFQEVFDFILNMEATNIQEGRYRVGRDDSEWKEATFILPDKNITEINKDKLVEKINKILDIKLEYTTTEKFCLPWERNDEKVFYYHEIYDYEHFWGMACASHDINSTELRKNSFFKLLDDFVKHFLYINRKWCYQTRLWKYGYNSLGGGSDKYNYDLHFY